MSPNKQSLEFSRRDTVYGSHTIPLYASPQPVVPALTLEDLNLIRQWHNAVKDAYVNYLQACDADTFAKIEALISAGKETI
jgi:hypothetical protein